MFVSVCLHGTLNNSIIPVYIWGDFQEMHCSPVARVLNFAPHDNIGVENLEKMNVECDIETIIILLSPVGTYNISRANNKGREIIMSSTKIILSFLFFPYVYHTIIYDIHIVRVIYYVCVRVR